MVDYKGQARAETLLVVCFVVICTPAWIYGYFQQDFTYPLQAWMAATVLSALVRHIFSEGHVASVLTKHCSDCCIALTFLSFVQLVLPNWPIYNRNPVKWLPSAMYVKKKSS
ncbi:hypothetical protein P3T76_012836 [Phytophthora citrophthora]|uniref:Signal peptidase complex subunit 1 n=1 Tax=Phytophthora citrophthora TaxID=4793 RepID=A0AAD9LDC6_9STRA|nr:hypothetical protein P3T76_012836 [Phytophthora citrophthora]